MHTIFGMHSHKVRIHTLLLESFLAFGSHKCNSQMLRVATVGQTTPATQAREISWCRLAPQTGPHVGPNQIDHHYQVFETVIRSNFWA